VIVRRCRGPQQRRAQLLGLHSRLQNRQALPRGEHKGRILLRSALSLRQPLHGGQIVRVPNLLQGLKRGVDEVVVIVPEQPSQDHPVSGIPCARAIRTCVRQHSDERPPVAI